MIDEKDLNEILDNNYEPFGSEISVNTTKELIRLARLGLWAEKHGIPAVKKYADLDDWGYDHSSNSDCDYGQRAQDALTALPKDAK